MLKVHVFMIKGLMCLDAADFQLKLLLEQTQKDLLLFSTMSPGCRATGCCNRAQSDGWIYPTLLLCLFGFFSLMRPIDSFSVAYLIGPDKNITIEQVLNEILPVWTYSYLVMLVPVFLLTDYLRHKPVICFHGLILIINYTTFTFGQGVLVFQFSSFLYGMVAATEVAYYSYIYSIVGTEHYQKVTSYCRSVTLVGHTLASVLGQVLVSVWNVSYFYLNVISLVSASAAFLFSILLPMPKKSMFFHREEEAENIQVPPSTEDVEPKSENISPQNNVETPTFSQLPVISDGEALKQNVDGLVKAIDHHSRLKVLFQLWSDLKECYSSPRLLYWSIWWALATSGYYQILSYVQVLWDHVEPSQNTMVHNGGADAVSNLMGATTSFAIGYIKLDWAIWGELTLGIFTAVNCGLLYAMAFSNNIWVCYACYVLLKGSYMLLITIATFLFMAVTLQ
ncbi:thiamine transporter 2-like isoform X2 [Heterodontus francisci]|uniref:thiamine transporter 2-like isoform X2 n=1 Tax=Heterodontus francisci TaxID=7792 RepID=UPI00355BA40A